jgi:alkanesulfonate monooxygenase SsuD/methylene tetrahydromethanopterin reductase-like flavin-dependent oxidoreductase (luciferase family)
VETVVRIVFFSLMAYPDLPEPDERHSTWVDPNPTWWNPEVGNRAYHAYLNELEYADALGYDGIGMNEHHNCAYVMSPSPNVWASAVARRTNNAAICVLGNTLVNYPSPVRVAEEFAQLDTVSGGRLIAGMVPGTTMDTAYSYGVNPSTLRQRYLEAVELIKRAWTADEPFEFNGRFSQYRYVNPWPKPAQDPHPPIWMPAGGSRETWELAARLKHVYAHLTLGSLQSVETINAGYWDMMREMGREPNPFSCGAVRFVFVADDMKMAEEIYAPHVDYFMQRVLKWDPRFTYAPGYLSEATVRMGMKSAMAESAKKVAKTGLKKDDAGKGVAHAELGAGVESFRSLVEQGVLVAGSPEQCTEQLVDFGKRFNIGNMVLCSTIGNMPERIARYNTKMFADHVMPNLRPLFENEWEHEWWPKPLANRVPLHALQTEPDPNAGPVEPVPVERSGASTRELGQ